MNAFEAAGRTVVPTTDDLFLGGALAIRQPKNGYRAGTDAVLLAALMAPETLAAGPVLDVGAGVGVIGLCVAQRCPSARAVLLERDPCLAALARDNVHRNAVSDRVSVVETDIARATAALEGARIKSESFPVVLANPPYHDERRSTVAESPLKAVSHQMSEDRLEIWARFMCRMAAPGGRAAMIHKAEALSRILETFEGRFGSIGVLPIYAYAGEPAIRVIVDGIKGSRAPLYMRPGLVLHTPEQRFVPEIEAIFRHGAPLPPQYRG
ncbi:methyltransferase small [Hyphomicrobium denitrificans 1NES1]|uniref:Methyltransferase small n=1 Tax=Hyphomicrobium denitrificans 1NES1 TaxID=670307 RepID=N0BAF2_9HYPH|nr:methyltransferase [Hyphomicrobium denitrificans]AGK59247.1 methyltransferase small [Hyphomicrobium denitrificans 1NES1]